MVSLSVMYGEIYMCYTLRLRLLNLDSSHVYATLTIRKHTLAYTHHSQTQHSVGCAYETPNAITYGGERICNSDHLPLSRQVMQCMRTIG